MYFSDSNYVAVHTCYCYNNIELYTSGLVINENVVFHKTNEVYANNAQWMVTFVHDLRLQKKNVNKIKNDLDTTHEIINHMMIIDY